LESRQLKFECPWQGLEARVTIGMQFPEKSGGLLNELEAIFQIRRCVRSAIAAVSGGVLRMQLVFGTAAWGWKFRLGSVTSYL
jgi:hypothetical protein